MKKIQIVIYYVILLFMFNCAPKSNLIYMGDADDIATQASVKNSSQIIQPGDQLGIWITAEEMEAVAPFNQNLVQLENINNTMPSSNQAQRSATGQIPTYIVRTDHTITFPVIGKISTEGKTLEMFEQELTQSLTKYIYNPVVSLRTLNYKVTVLGEVNRPGTYTIVDNQSNLLSALGLAGDLTKYGLRDNILVVRNENGKISKNRVDITRSDFINSPYYYMKQNDVIYVSANETVGRQSRLNPNASLYLSMASIIVTILALVFRN